MEFKRNFYHESADAAAFFDLQELVFPGLDLAFALSDCHLDQASIPYGLFVGETAVSILNVTPQTILLGDNTYQSAQIGTVATHPDWRGQGLSARLLKKALADFAQQVDFFFLFANSQVLNFYPRFGFRMVTEHRFERPFSSGANRLRQLHLTNPSDREFFRRRLAKTTPVSTHFGVANYNVLREFVLIKFMPDVVWWDEAAEVCLVAVAEKGRLIIHDLIGKKLPANYLENLCWPDIHTLETWFTPNLFTGEFQTASYKNNDDQLFVFLNVKNPDLMHVLDAPFRVPVLAKT